MAPVTLYFANNTRCNLVRQMLEELSVEYKLHSYAKKEDPASCHVYKKEFPVTTIPGLDDNGVKLFESGAICQYLLDVYGGSKLIPKDKAEKADYYNFLWFSEATLIPAALDAAYSGDATKNGDKFQKLYKNLDIVEDKLSDGRKWVAGSTFTAADIHNGCSLWMVAGQVLDVISDDKYPKLAAYNKRLEEVPSFKKAYKAD